MLPLLAAEAVQFTLPLTPEQFSEGFAAYQVMGVVLTLGTIAAIAVSIWDKLRRKDRPDPDFATKVELAAIETRLSREISTTTSAHRSDIHNLYEKLGLLTSSMDNSMRDVARALGRLEGMGDIAGKIREGFVELVDALPCVRNPKTGG
jgi:hypothetical protein